MTKYFKIQYGYDKQQSVPITEEELPKALHMFLSGKGRGIFGDTAIRGKDIVRIEPDWHTAMGWNKTWKMDEYDHREIAPLLRGYKQAYGEVKMMVQDLVSQGKEDLLLLPMSKIKEKIKLLA